MASSYYTESEAPRDFRVSSTESDGHYTKCHLCYTVKRNFYCTDCVRTGNFVHSSMPYADRFSEKQAKLQRVKANRKYILDRCEKLFLPKLKKDTTVTDEKHSRDKLDLLRLAIEQRRNNIEEKKKKLAQLKAYNNELELKLPRYQKRVATLGRHAQQQSIELQNKVSVYNDKTDRLAALRRSRIRQLTRYIFPIYMTYDTSDSIEDLEFIVSEADEEPPRRCQLHVVAPWLCVDGDISHLTASVLESREPAAGAAGADAAHRAQAALALAAQLLALLAWTLDARSPHALQLSEFSNWRVAAWSAAARVRRVCACAAALARAHARPALHPLCALHALALAAAADQPPLGRPAAELAASAADWAATWSEAWAAHDDGDDAEPEHLCWPEHETEELSSSPPAAAPAPAPSLVTSAAASLASMWRGWTK